MSQTQIKAEAKRLRKQDKRLSVRDGQMRDDFRPLPLRLTKGKGGHGRNRINVHRRAS